jgi:hypothetical protein
MNIKYHADTLIIETFLANDTLVKNADGIMSNLPDKIQEYVTSKMKPGHEIESVLSMFAPGAIFLFLRASNPILAILLSTVAGTFQLNIEEMIESVFSAIKPDIAQGKKVDPAKIDAAAASAAAAQSSAPAPAKAPAEAPAKKEEDDGLNVESSFKNQLKFARKLRLALIAYENDNSEFQFSKYAIPAGITGTGTKSFLSRIISWLFKAILLSAGFLLVGDVLNEYVLHRPNSLSGGVQKGVAVDTLQPSAPVVVSTQTKFKPNPSFHDETHKGAWGVSVQATPTAIEEMLIDFAKEVYLGLDGLESVMRSSPAFQIVKNRIVNNNKSNEGYNVTSIPSYLPSKKQIVDTFIDNVAKMSP